MNRLIVIAAIALVGCGKSSSGGSSTETPKEPAKPGISASPNPVPAGAEKTGSTTITWSVGDPAKTGQVWLLVHLPDGTKKPETLVTTGGSSGTQSVSYISKGVKYEFILYEGTEHANALARVTVTRE